MVIVSMMRYMVISGKYAYMSPALLDLKRKQKATRERSAVASQLQLRSCVC